jgi:hypothetical protein
VRWRRMPVADVVEVEPKVIRELRPLLNTTHNPECCAELADLRELCRRIACVRSSCPALTLSPASSEAGSGGRE